MYWRSEREPSSGENSTSSRVFARLRDRRARLAASTCSRVICSLCSMWMSLVAMKVWIRGRSDVAHRLPAPRRCPACGPRQAADHRAFHLPRDRLHRLEVARRGDREARLDDVHPQPRQLLCDLQLLVPVQRDARRLLAVAQRRIEDHAHDAASSRTGTACRSLMSFCSFLVSRSNFLRLCLRLRGRHALFPPRGEE